ncbi:KAP family NTPase [Pseudomonas sp. NPDC089396]|uniref:KAP family NTPase n=1 Tax=Pseudomonas sp. NPDC089396 TaxID=3364461 RepID=UPI003835EAF7
MEPHDIDHIQRQDRAIEDADFDALDRGPFVASLVKTLVHTEHGPGDNSEISRRATGFVVGLTGEWGLGKSSVLNLLSHELKQMDGVVVANLNPWLFKGRDELVEAYFNSLRDALGSSVGEKLFKFREQLDRYKASIEFVGTTTASLVDVLVGTGAATTFYNRWLLKLLRVINKPRALSASQERKKLEIKLADAKIAVVVLIDELDRVEDDEVRAVAQLVKAVGDIRGISYLVAYDPDRVAQALGRGATPEEKLRTGESYLEKIIQFPIPLRPLFEDDARDLLLRALRTNGVTVPSVTQPYQQDIFNQLLRDIRTPREIKRLIGAFSVLEEIVRGEICPFDVLAYSWLVAKAPSIRGRISENVHQLVDDPGVSEMMTRHRQQQSAGSGDQTLIEIFGNSAQRHMEILRLLFPRFAEGSQRYIEQIDGQRLAKRRNLVRLLYLGNPPGQFSRADIERLWELTSAEALLVELKTLLIEGQLGSLLDRIGDFSANLPQPSSNIFWVVVSRVLVRENDWIAGEEAERGLVDDVGSLLWRISRGSTAGRSWLWETVHTLIQDGDLLIAPWILRKHLFAHGLTPYSNNNNGDYLFDEAETITLRQTEIPRYRQAVIDGVVLRKLPDTEAIFCIVNSSAWDEGLRVCLTAQINSMDALKTFAGLMMPPGILCDLSTLDLMLEANTVLRNANELLRENGMPESEWLAAAIRRLRAVLAGRDVHSAGALRDDFSVDEEEPVIEVER